MLAQEEVLYEPVDQGLVGSQPHLDEPARIRVGGPSRRDGLAQQLLPAPGEALPHAMPADVLAEGEQSSLSLWNRLKAGARWLSYAAMKSSVAKRVR